MKDWDGRRERLRGIWRQEGLARTSGQSMSQVIDEADSGRGVPCARRRRIGAGVRGGGWARKRSGDLDPDPWLDQRNGSLRQPLWSQPAVAQSNAQLAIKGVKGKGTRHWSLVRGSQTTKSWQEAQKGWRAVEVPVPAAEGGVREGEAPGLAGEGGAEEAFRPVRRDAEEDLEEEFVEQPRQQLRRVAVVRWAHLFSPNRIRTLAGVG
ncbi:hypothetical protein BRADI_5g18346v3 [Brachypodium distachyon]|uniref:Uncharacterized protein n=1 Tax=Brachypodium distachyon TaxID=15368 RepID=A0A2K2CHZ7_BRADI|nr:hypothetical protein BRADI_5g18346v3 [Brachypodium distachyon]